MFPLHFDSFHELFESLLAPDVCEEGVVFIECGPVLVAPLKASHPSVCVSQNVILQDAHVVSPDTGYTRDSTYFAKNYAFKMLTCRQTEKKYWYFSCNYIARSFLGSFRVSFRNVTKCQEFKLVSILNTY